LRLFESLIKIDFSCTSIAVGDVEGMVSVSPQLRTLIVRESTTIRGTVVLRSSTLQSIDFHFCTNLCDLSVHCPPLESLDVRGCLSLRELLVKSAHLETLDLSMLSRLSDLDVTACAQLQRLDLSGCGLLPRHHWAHRAVPPEAMMSHALALADEQSATAAMKGAAIESSPRLLRHLSFASDVSTDTNNTNNTHSEKSEIHLVSKGGSRFRRKSRRSASL
jgi:hypothetical protein